MSRNVGAREVVRTSDLRIPAFKVSMETAGIRVTSWVTDTGEIVREDSPAGLMTVREAAATALEELVLDHAHDLSRFARPASARAGEQIRVRSSSFFVLAWIWLKMARGKSGISYFFQ